MRKKLLLILILFFCSNVLLADSPRIISNIKTDGSNLIGKLQISGITETNLKNSCYYENGTLSLWIAAIGNNYSQVGKISNCAYSDDKLNCEISISNLKNDQYKIWIGPGVFSDKCQLPNGYVKDYVVDNMTTIEKADIYEVATLESVLTNVKVNETNIEGNISISNISQNQLSKCFYTDDGSVGLWVAAIGSENSKVGKVSNCSYSGEKLSCNFEIKNLNDDRYKIWVGPGIYSENNCLISNGYVKDTELDVNSNNATIYTVSQVNSQDSSVYVENNSITGKIKLENIPESQLSNCYYQNDGNIGLWVAAIGNNNSAIGKISDCSYNNGELVCNVNIDNLKDDTYRVWIGPGIFTANNCLMPNGYLKDGKFDSNLNDASTFIVSLNSSGVSTTTTVSPSTTPTENVKISIEDLISNDVGIETGDYVEISSDKLKDVVGENGEIDLSNSNKPIFFKDNKIPENIKIVGGEILGGVKGDVNLSEIVKNTDLEENLRKTLPEIKNVSLKPQNGKIYLENIILNDVKLDITSPDSLTIGEGVIFDRDTINNIESSLNKELSIKQALPEVNISAKSINIEFKVPSPSFPIMVDNDGNMLSPAKLAETALKNAGLSNISTNVEKDGILQFDISGVKINTFVKDVLVGNANNFSANNVTILKNGEFLLNENGLNIVLAPMPYNINDIDSLFASVKKAIPDFSSNIDENGILTASWTDNGKEKKIVTCFNGIIKKSESTPSQLELSLINDNGYLKLKAVYPDGNEEYWVPCFIGLNTLEEWLDKLQNENSLKSWYFDRNNGVLSITQVNGDVVKVVPDFSFREPTTEEKSKLTSTSDNVSIENIGNNWFLITPEGVQKFNIAK